MFYEYFFNFVLNALQQYNYPIVFLLSFLEVLFTPLPSEIVLPFVGYLAYKQNNILIIIFSIPLSALGSTLASLVLYYIGYKARNFVFKYGKYFFITTDKLIKAQNFFLKYKENMLIIGRFVPGIRSAISIPAGIFRVNLKIFIIYSIIAFSIWSSILILFGYFLAENWEKTLEYSFRIDIIGLILFISFIAYYIYKIKSEKKYRFKRRKFL